MISVFLSVWLLWMSVLDCKSCSVPKWLMWSGGSIGLVLYLGSLMWNRVEVPGIKELVIGWMLGALPGIGLLLVAHLTASVGYGDGVVLTVLGIVAGMQRAVLVLAAALFAAAIFSVILLGFRKVKRNSRLPFLPFLTAGWFLVGMVGGGM